MIKKFFRMIIYSVAYGFGAGLLPKMPGTFGTLVGFGLYFLLIPLGTFYYLCLVSVLFIISIFICDYVEKEIGIRDYAPIVLDEVISFLFILGFTPVTWGYFLYAFIVFRFFDILKPWPINVVEEKTNGGFSIMIDDLVAAIFTIIIVRLTYMVIG